MQTCCGCKSISSKEHRSLTLRAASQSAVSPNILQVWTQGTGDAEQVSLIGIKGSHLHWALVSLEWIAQRGIARRCTDNELALVGDFRHRSG